MREDLVFELSGSFEDELAFTVVPRELYRKYRGKYNIFIITSRKILWRGNKFIKATLPAHQEAIKIPGTEEHLRAHPEHSDTHILELQLRIAEQLIDSVSDLSLSEFRPHLRFNNNYAVGNPELSSRADYTPYWVVHTDYREKPDVLGWDSSRWFNVVTFLKNSKYKLDMLQLSTDHTLPCTGVKGVSNLRELNIEATLWLIQHSHGVITTDYIIPHIASAMGRPCIVIAGGSRSINARAYTEDIIERWFGNKSSYYIELVNTLMPQDYLTGTPCSPKPCGSTNLAGGKTCANIIEPHTYSGPSSRVSKCMDGIKDKDVIDKVIEYEEVMEKIGYNEVDLAIQEIFKEVQKGD